MYERVSPRRMACSLLAALALPVRADIATPAPEAARIVGLELPGNPISRKAREGYELAVELANRRGGLRVGGRRVPVELVLAPDPETSAAARGAAAPVLEALVARTHPIAIVQNYVGITSAYDEQAEVAERLRIPWVNAGTASRAVFQHGRRFSFGMLSPIAKIPDSILRWIDDVQKAGAQPKPRLRLALVWTGQSGVNAREFREGALEWLRRTSSRRASYEVVLDEEARADPSSDSRASPESVAAVVAHLAERAPDVLLAYANLEGYVALQRAILARGLCFDIASFGARGTEAEAAQALGADGTSYLLTAVWWTPRMRQTGPGMEFVDAFRRKHGRDPEWYQAVSYESIRAVLVAVERANSLEPVKVRDELAALRIESLVPGGSLSFPPSDGQEAQYPMVVLQNLPGGATPVVYPRIVAQQKGVAPNPRCHR